jgi:hypothetical protein
VLPDGSKVQALVVVTKDGTRFEANSKIRKLIRPPGMEVPLPRAASVLPEKEMEFIAKSKERSMWPGVWELPVDRYRKIDWSTIDVDKVVWVRLGAKSRGEDESVVEIGAVYGDRLIYTQTGQVYRRDGVLLPNGLPNFAYSAKGGPYVGGWCWAESNRHYVLEGDDPKGARRKACRRAEAYFASVTRSQWEKRAAEARHEASPEGQLAEAERAVERLQKSIEATRGSLRKQMDKLREAVAIRDTLRSAMDEKGEEG